MGPGPKRNLGLNPDIPCEVVATQSLEQSLLPTRICMSRKLQSGLRARNAGIPILNVNTLTDKLKKLPLS